MRRLLSLVLLAAFGLPVVAPALALGEDADARLPACCRRNGAHHCMMNMTMARPADGPAIGAVCPFFPQPSTTPPAGTFAGFASIAPLDAPHAFTLAATPRAGTLCRLARERSHLKRGPPQDLL